MTTATLTRFPPAQLAVIALAAQGLNTAAIAEILDIRFDTVKDRFGHALRATGAGDRAGLVGIACRAGQLQDVPDQARGPVTLTPQTTKVLGGVADGLTNRAISRRIGRKESTVKSHVAKLLRDLGASDRAHAVLIAWQLRILPEAGR